MKKETEDPNSSLKKIGLLGVIVGVLVGYTGAGFGLGYLAWQKWGAPWWVILILGVISFSLAIFKIYEISEKNL